MDESSAKLIYRNLLSLSFFQIPQSYPHVILNRDGSKVCASIKQAGIFLKNQDVTNKNFIYLSSYLLVTVPYARALANYIGNKKCLEIMSGTGCLTAALRKYAIDIIPTTEKNNRFNYLIGSDWCDDIQDLDALAAIEMYGKVVDYIIASFPCPQNSLDYKCVLKMREINPMCKMIYIGNITQGLPQFVSNDFCTYIRDTGQMMLLHDINQHIYHRRGEYDYTYLIV